jgi:hypothetical protein
MSHGKVTIVLCLTFVTMIGFSCCCCCYSCSCFESLRLVFIPQGNINTNPTWLITTWSQITNAGGVYTGAAKLISKSSTSSTACIVKRMLLCDSLDFI